MMHQESFALVILGQAGFALIFGATTAVTAPTMIDMLPADVRCSGVSIAYKLALGVFGGSAPLVATCLVERTHDGSTPAYCHDYRHGDAGEPAHLEGDGVDTA